MQWRRWVYRYRGVLAAPPLVFAALSDLWEAGYDLIVWPAGVVVFLSGVLLRLWAQQHVHFRLKVPMQFTHTGPYVFVRNPIYLGNILICLGATVCSKLFWLIPVTLLWILGVYHLVIRYEEAGLVEQYGDAYRRYLSEVPRWIPRLSPRANPEFINEYFRASLLAEAHCVLVLLPYILKAVVLYWARH